MVRTKQPTSKLCAGQDLKTSAAAICDDARWIPDYQAAPRTPLMTAMLSFHLGNRVNVQRTTEVLIAANADLNAVDHNGQSALFMAVYQAAPSASNFTYLVPASVCISLIDAGQNFRLQ